MFDTSDLVFLLFGILSGAGGQYLASKYTDQRRRQEADSESRKAFKQLQAAMPALFAEMKADIGQDATGLIREFVILPRKTVAFWSDKTCFEYYETEHEELKAKVDLIENLGFGVDVTPGNAPIYRMNEEFVTLHKRSKL